MIAPDRQELSRFVAALFCRADPDSFVSMRAFFDLKDGFALYNEWQTVRVTGNDEDIIDAAEDLAALAALDDEAIVFAPPICTFARRDKADEASLANGLVISAELDVNPTAGRQHLEAILGPATLVMESGGLWVDANSGELIPKLHLHWRLASPTRSKIDQDFLKEANKLAAALAGGDPSGVPLVHPLRWAGSWHKKAAPPRLAQIVDFHPEIEISLAEALTKLRAAASAPSDEETASKPNGVDHQEADLLDLCAALALIANDDTGPDSWSRWNDMGLRIFAASQGSEGGLALFLYWSRRSPKFNAANTRARWTHYAKSPPDRTNAGAIFKMARKIYPGLVRPSQYARQAAREASLAEFYKRQPPTPRLCSPAEHREATFPRQSAWQSSLILSKKTIRPCLANAITALRTAPEWDDRLWFDAFHNQVVLHDTPPWSNKFLNAEPWSDLFNNLATNWMHHQGILVSSDILGQAVWTVAQDRWFHPVRQYLAKCQKNWDHTPRLFNWPTIYLGTPFNNYSSAVGQRWLISLIARVMEPGCKSDCSLVLEGLQGTLKSEAIRSLGHPWVTDDMGGAELGSKDAAIQVAGIWIFELAELDQFTAEGKYVSRAKAFMSRPTDRFRPPYGKNPIAQPRQCAFACTTNKREYLPDETGNRRWWPLGCNLIKLDQIKSDRDHLLGEAVSLYEQGLPWWLDIPELNDSASKEQQERYLADAWEEKIAEYVEEIAIRARNQLTVSIAHSVSVGEILSEVLRLKPAEWDQIKQNRVARCLRSLHWQQFRVQDNGKRQRRYYPPGVVPDTLDDNQ
jgi:predicted P-loop ATPase